MERQDLAESVSLFFFSLSCEEDLLWATLHIQVNFEVTNLDLACTCWTRRLDEVSCQACDVPNVIITTHVMQLTVIEERFIAGSSHKTYQLPEDSTTLLVRHPLRS